MASPEEAARPRPAGDGSIATAGTLVLAVAILYLGRDILIPLALAVLLGFVLTPPMLWLRRHGIPRVLAVILVVFLAASAILGIIFAVGSQVVQLAGNLPSYQRNIETKLSGLRAAAPGAGVIERVTKTLSELRQELTAPQSQSKPEPRSSSETRPRQEPVPVVVEPAPMQPLEIVQAFLGPLLSPLATAALVVLFLVFFLLEREDIRDRFIRLAGSGDIQRSTEAINEASARVSRYLLMQLLVNVTYGIPIGIGLFLIGVPNAILWGMLATVLRFIPYLGPWLAALFPLAIAFGEDPGWSMLLWTVALFLVIELISNNVLEPWLYGSSAGLSSFAVILAAIFWTTLWGPVGLFLATPLTVCLVVIGRYVPRLAFLDVLLGSEPVLTPAERLCQRLISGNVDEATDLAEEYVKEHSTLAFYDDVAIPALRLAIGDAAIAADVEVRRNIAEAAAELVTELEDEKSPAKADPTVELPSRVLCIGSRTQLDEAGALMLASRLRERGFGAKSLPPISVAANAIGQLDLSGIRVICLSYVESSSRSHARFVSRRLLRMAPDLRIVVCCWEWDVALAPIAGLQERLGPQVSVVTSIADAEVAVDGAMGGAESAVPHREIPDRESRMIERMRAIGLLTGKGQAFRDLAERAAARFQQSILMIAAIDEVCMRTLGSDEKPDQLSALLCWEVAGRGETILVGDVAEDDRFSANSELLEKGIRSFALAPLRSRSGFVIGAVGVLSSITAEFDDAVKQWLEHLAGEIIGRLERERDEAEPTPEPLSAAPA